jgi:nicotinamide-nucleotide amidase
MALFPAELATEARRLLTRLRAEALHLATAESCTGGLIAALLTDIPGSSDVVDRGFITYSNDAKIEMLGVAPALVAEHGAVSAEVARAMAEGALIHSFADIAVSVTGVAGPGGGSPEKPIGLVHFAAARLGGQTLHEVHRFGEIERGEIRLRSVAAALALVWRMVEHPERDLRPE